MRTSINKAFPEKFSRQRQQVFAEREPLFTVVGDLDMRQRYGDGAICFEQDRLTVFGDQFDGQVKTVPYETLREVRVKRMYGNAYFSATYKDGTTERLMRFTFFRYSSRNCRTVMP